MVMVLRPGRIATHTTSAMQAMATDSRLIRGMAAVLILTPYNLPMPSPAVVDSVLAAIGHTPVVRLRRIVPAASADVFVKLEYFNPTGSYKDRMALAMIDGAEARGVLRPGMRVIEFTGGSTGSSLAMVCAIKGYEFSTTLIRRVRARENRHHAGVWRRRRDGTERRRHRDAGALRSFPRAHRNPPGAARYVLDRSIQQ